MERYTMVPDEATLAALERLSGALGPADAALPDGLARANPLSLSVLGDKQLPVPLGDDFDGAVGHFDGGLIVDRVCRPR